MGFLDKNNDELRLILTPHGKVKFLSEGLKDTFVYFTFSDDDLLYHLCVEPQGILEINGSHKSSTTIKEPKYKVKIRDNGE
jgi:hypothetical protein